MYWGLGFERGASKVVSSFSSGDESGQKALNDGNKGSAEAAEGGSVRQLRVV